METLAKEVRNIWRKFKHHVLDMHSYERMNDVQDFTREMCVICGRMKLEAKE